MFTRRRQSSAVPEVGAEAPEFNLPSAQGGQLRLSMRTARGPVVVVFVRGPHSEEDVAFFEALASKEDEINHAGASVVGVGVLEPDEARSFVAKTSMKSYVLYDYTGVTARQWGLLERDRKRGDYARPALFVVDGDRKVAASWVGERPKVEDVLAKVTEITGLPKPPEEAEGEKGGESEAPKKKMSAEERERIKAERRAAREAGESVKTAQPEGSQGTESAGAPKKMSAEDRERIKAERRAAREAGKSLKKPGAGGPDAAEKPAGEAPKKKMSAEERERIKAERRAAREAGKSLKKPAGGEGEEKGE